MSLQQAVWKNLRALLLDVALTLLLILSGGTVVASPPKPKLLPAPAPWVVPLQSKPFQLEGKSYQEKVRVPVVVKELAPNASTLKFELLSVTSDGIQNESLHNHFLPLKFKRIGRNLGTLVVMVNLTHPLLGFDNFGKIKPNSTRRDLAAGNYDLIVAVSNPRAPQRASQRLVLRIVHPTARLRPPDKLVIEQVQPWHGLNRLLGRESNSAFLLQETSGRSRVSNIQVAVYQDSSNRSHFAKQGLSFKPGAALAGRQASIPWESGNFPIGTTTGTLEIKAPQMAGALLVPFEVRARRTRLLILLFIWLGLALGWGARSLLADSIKLKSAKVQTSTLSGQMGRAYERFRDATFRLTILQEINALTALSNSPGATVESINQGQQKAQEKFQEAMNDLNARIAAQQARLTEFAEKVKAPWFLPPAVAEVLRQCRARLDAAASQLQAGDADGAAETLNKTTIMLVEQTRSALGDWRHEVSEALAAFTSHAPPDLRQTQSGVIAALRAETNNIQLSAQAGATEVVSALNAVDAARQKLREEVVGLPQELRDLALSVTDKLKMSTTQAPVSNLFENINHLGNEASHDATSANTPEKFLQQFAEGLRGLYPSWEKVFTTRLDSSKLSQADQASVLNLLGERRYVEAAHVAARLMAKAQDLGRTDSATPSAQDDEPAPLDNPRFDGSMQQYVAPSPAPPAPVTLDVDQAQKALQADIFQQRLLIVSGFTLLGYFLFADEFFGTTKELITIFTWAFGLNITVEALTQNLPGRQQEQKEQKANP